MDRHLCLTLFIPALFLLVTGGIRSLVRGKVTWANFYLGLDLSLAALANGLVNIADVLHDIEKSAITDAVAESSEETTEADVAALPLENLPIPKKTDEAIVEIAPPVR